MSGHDPCCPMQSDPRFEYAVCMCDSIHEARVDERERIAHAIDAACDEFRQALADVAHGPAVVTAYIDAARIARSEGGDC